MGAEKFENFDVVIIGGSVAGSLTGKLISEKGYSVLILEEHYEIGKPVQCAGLVTTRVLEFVEANDIVLNTVKGANIYSPKGHKLVIDDLRQRTVVIDRSSLDRTLITDAIRAGCDLLIGAKAIEAVKSKDGNCVEIKYLHNGAVKRVNCKILIGADGVQSNVARWFNLPKPEIILSGFGAEVVGANIKPDRVTIIAGNDIAPNFFAWIIPIGNGTGHDSGQGSGVSVNARVGLCVHDAPNPAQYYFEKLFNSNPITAPILKHSNPIQYNAGAIPIGPLSKTYCDNVMLVGDAAAQAKPTSGGGIYTALICAEFCAVTSITALEANDFSETTLNKYQKLWNRKFGKELKRAKMLHKAFTHLTDSQLDEGFKILNDEKLLKIISEYGDIDYPWKLAKIVFRKVPAMLIFAKPFLKALI